VQATFLSGKSPSYLARPQWPSEQTFKLGAPISLAPTGWCSGPERVRKRDKPGAKQFAHPRSPSGEGGTKGASDEDWRDAG
jgi:hypothetical protein